MNTTLAFRWKPHNLILSWHSETFWNAVGIRFKLPIHTIVLLLEHPSLICSLNILTLSGALILNRHRNTFVETSLNYALTYISYVAASKSFGSLSITILAY